MVVLDTGGRQVKKQVLETNGQVLVEAVKLVPRPRHLCMEEGTHCAWLYEVLKPHLDELVVICAGESKGNKSDELDAYRLAEGLRIGKFKSRVYKEEGGYGKLRELGHVYQKIVEDDVRVKNPAPHVLAATQTSARPGGATTLNQETTARSCLPSCGIGDAVRRAGAWPTSLADLAPFTVAAGPFQG